MTVRRKISVIGTILLIAIGLAITTSATPALAATGQVITTEGDVLHVWNSPTQPHSVVGTLNEGTTVSFSCYAEGDAVAGPYGTEKIWDRLDSPYAGGWVSDAWIRTGSSNPVVPRCGGSPATNCSPNRSVTPSGAYGYDNLARQPRTNAHRATDLALEAAAQAGIFAKAGPVSFKLLQHYLGASGTQYTVSINDLMINQPPLVASYNHYLRLNTAAAVARLEATVPASSCGSASISSGWVGYTITDRGDWYYALRNFGYQLAGTVWIGPAGTGGVRPITITYRGLVADTYNFNSNDSTYGRFEQLARDGWAADFRVSGQTGIYTASESTAHFGTSSLGMPLP
jgi:hypothetical protein